MKGLIVAVAALVLGPTGMAAAQPAAPPLNAEATKSFADFQNARTAALTGRTARRRGGRASGLTRRGGRHGDEAARRRPGGTSTQGQQLPHWRGVRQRCRRALPTLISAYRPEPYYR
jgi:hypothetical protein